jgi:hypothetical protein
MTSTKINGCYGLIICKPLARHTPRSPATTSVQPAPSRTSFTSRHLNVTHADYDAN